MDSLHDIHALVKMEDYEEVKKLSQELQPAYEGSGENPQPSENVEDEDYLNKMQSS